jgi:hypothetical protein
MDIDKFSESTGKVLVQRLYKAAVLIELICSSYNYRIEDILIE